MTTPTSLGPLDPELIIALRKAKLHILAHPETYDQGEGTLRSKCGCLVVHANSFLLENLYASAFENIERNYDTRIDRLYSRLKWPEEVFGGYFSGFYRLTLFDRAVIGACVIELFILTNGFDEFLP